MRLPRFVFPLFLLTFLIGTPALLLYTAGYSYNFSTHKLEQVGFLLIDGTPKDADVYLSNKLIAQQMPLYVKRAIPDSYAIRIEKEGYVPYETDVRIAPRQSVVYSPLYLIRKEVPQQLSASLGTLLYFDEQRGNAYFVSTANPRDVLVYHVTTSVTQKISLPFSVSNITPFITEHSLAFVTPTRSFILNLENFEVRTIIGKYTSLVVSSNDTIFAITNHSLVSLSSRDVVTVVDPTTSFTTLITALGNTVVGITSQGDTKAYFDGAYQTICSESLGELQAQHIQRGVGFASDADSSLMVTGEGRSVTCDNFNAPFVTFHNNNLVVSDDVSVSYFDKEHTERPIVRLRAPMTYFTVIPQTPYFVFVSNKQLYIYNSEDTRMKPYVYPFAIAPRALFPSPDGRTLFIDGIVDTTDGFFSLTLTDE